jgi:hypothetical protein
LTGITASKYIEAPTPIKIVKIADKNNVDISMKIKLTIKFIKCKMPISMRIIMRLKEITCYLRK